MIAIRIELDIKNPPKGYKAQKRLAEVLKKAAVDTCEGLYGLKVPKSESSVSRYVEREEMKP